MLYSILFFFLMITLSTKSHASDFFWYLDGHYFQEFKDKETKEVKASDLPLIEIGSLWKLYAYAYLKANNFAVPDYVPSGKDIEDAFCGAKGIPLNAESALAKSCGLFFEPKRLSSVYQNWSHFWSNHQPRKWYNQILQKKQNLKIPLNELLLSLNDLRENKIISPILSKALAGVVLNGTAKSGLKDFGSRLTVKTFTGVKDLKYYGGFAGWLPRGPVVWVRGSGKSHDVVAAESIWISKWLDLKSISVDSSCVLVNHFSRYPIKQLLNSFGEVVSSNQVLTGKFKVEFINGNSIQFYADGEITFNNSRITGLYKIDDYVARVIEREFNVEPQSVAEAMSIVVRTYLMQNANINARHCLEINDSTHTQRVGVSLPSRKAQRIAIKTSGLVLSKNNIRYNKNTWETGLRIFKEEADFPFILNSLYPKSVLQFKDGYKNWECNSISRAEKWMSFHKKKFDLYIKRELSPDIIIDVQVCQSYFSQPFSLLKEKKIFLNKFEDNEDQISLVHEYLHFYFTGTHRAQDERLIDFMAKDILKKTGGL